MANQRDHRFPLRLSRISRLQHCPIGCRRCPGLPTGIRATGRLYRRDEDELPLRSGREPLREAGTVMDFARRWQGDHIGDRSGRGCARAPRELRRFEHAQPRRNECHRAGTTSPVAPRTVLLVARRNTPARVRAEKPLIGRPVCRRAGQARTNRIHQRLGQHSRLGMVQSFIVDPAHHGISRGEATRHRIQCRRPLSGEHRCGQY